MITQTEASRLMDKRDRYAALLKNVQSNEARDDILYIIRVINDRIKLLANSLMLDINRRIREM